MRLELPYMAISTRTLECVGDVVYGVNPESWKQDRLGTATHSAYTYTLYIRVFTHLVFSGAKILMYW